ncbi:MAG: uL13 family ribosomal protein, partial [candidate division WOR-3 bacterium]
ESPIFVDYKRRYNAVSQTNPWRYGPKRPKNPDRFLRRVIRGMLPYTTARGRAAYERVLVYMGKPEREIEKKEGINLSKAKLADTSRFKKSYGYFMTVGHLCKYLGGKESL